VLLVGHDVGLEHGHGAQRIARPGHTSEAACRMCSR